MAEEFEVIRKKVYIAATQGDVATFQHLVQEDPHLLDLVSFNTRTPLHVATTWGQAAIVEEALRVNPRLARSLDSQKSTALHLAAEEGNVGIASKLLSVAPVLCWLRDCHGMNPVHIAAMNGHAEVLEELLRHDPSPAREKVDRGQTALHLCVKHGQLRALQVLVNRLGELLYAEDDDGEPVLHFAVRYKQIEIVQYLFDNRNLRKSSINSKGKTALQIARENRGDATSSEIIQILSPVDVNSVATLQWTRSAAMVVVILIAGMSYQSIISPPGGVWQDDSPEHKAGTSILASKHRDIYEKFMLFNTGAFTVSMFTIMHLATKPPSSTNIADKEVVMIGLLISMLSFFTSYAISTMVLTLNTKIEFPSCFLWPAIFMYCYMMAISPCCSYMVPRLSKSRLLGKLRVPGQGEGVVVIRAYCGDHLRKLSSFIDKHVWQIPSGENIGVHSNSTTTTRKSLIDNGFYPLSIKKSPLVKCGVVFPSALLDNDFLSIVF